MSNSRRISERELVLPALLLISERNGLTTSNLIKELTRLLQPTGKDAELLDDRSDTKFSQKVRNLLASHNTLIRLGYVTYDRSQPKSNRLHKITKKGQQFLVNSKYVEKSAIVEEKIARICWNEHNWQRPSGRYGKSLNKNTYEYKSGFGHEEWLLDTEKINDGYHYGYLEPIGKGWKKYEGKAFNISLYSINNATAERWWIGRINNVQIISKEESNKAYSEYNKRGWLKEMHSQLKSVDADLKYFVHSKPYYLFNLKYKPENLELLDVPLRFSRDDKVVKSTYYVLLNKEKEPKFEIPIDKSFKFMPGHKKAKETTRANYGQRESDIDLFHNKMVDASYNQLVKIYSEKKVGSELPDGLGSKIDLVVKENNESLTFYEFKTSNSIKICIREALSQLLEYAYYPNRNEATKLIIVSQNKINDATKEYLKRLREHFNIPIYYKQFNRKTDILEETEY